MSANNYLLIRKDFSVAECDADSGDCFNIGQGKDLKEAVAIAKKYQATECVEYGTHFE